RMQREWAVDGGPRTVAEDRIAELRREAAQLCRAVYQHLGLADFTDEHVERAVDAAGSKDLGGTDTLAVVAAAQAIRDGGITVVDVGAALDETGYESVAERILVMTAARLAGDYLQTSAIFDEELRVLSLVTDPNDYAGPGTGFEPGQERQAEIDAIRQARGVADLRAEQAASAVPLLAVAAPAGPRTVPGPGREAGDLGRGAVAGSGPEAAAGPGREAAAGSGREAASGQDPREVVIGVSPAVGRDVWR